MRTNPIPDGWNESCAPVPRCRFSAVESHPEEVSVGVPSIIGANQLETLRWMYRSQKGRDGLPKSIIDISQVPLHKGTNLAFIELSKEFVPGRTLSAAFW
jgi:hypothetical protein